jgi:hypothetical protein
LPECSQSHTFARFNIWIMASSRKAAIGFIFLTLLIDVSGLV